MKFHLYRSDCMQGQYALADIDIMREALRYNRRHGITGFLHRTKTQYFQYIEGPRDEIDALIPKIKSDKRHVRYKTLDEGSSQQRLFGCWSMGYSHHQDTGTVLTSDSSVEAIMTLLMEQADSQSGPMSGQQRITYIGPRLSRVGRTQA